ncbi:hypothetical protein Q9Q95_06125 [Sphingomonas sp. DG1-23]|uniref:hypothetical protein n=1 Tax=Sphingomonas sp. DG1-23 TaxID=3068316 RepID=UPI00273F5EF7|nr:hypothetical protein [Sphingomonas sp. DG1-23]MDP5278495.1 hypothetical protein [Sphingomonas sp. DG1-23]
MSLGRAVRNLRPAGLILYGTIGALILLIVCFPLLFPRGIRIGGPAPLEGLFVVADGDWAHASFERRALLEKNERLRPRGMQEVGHLCLDAAAVRSQLERALGQARRDRFGGPRRLAAGRGDRAFRRDRLHRAARCPPRDAIWVDLPGHCAARDPSARLRCDGLHAEQPALPDTAAAT